MNILRDIANSIFDHLIGLLPPDRAYPRSIFEKEPVPWLVSHFLTHTLQRSVDLELESLRAARSDWFDYEHTEVQHAYRTFTLVLAAHAQIPKDEWSDKLERTVYEVLSYLVRPAQTLVDFTFQDENEPLPMHVIYRRMAYFGAYAYLREVVRAYAEQKSLHNLDRSRFASLLNRSDRRMTTDYGVEEWLRLLAPLYEFIHTVPNLTSSGIPIGMLQIFFEDKGAEKIVRRLSAAQKSGQFTTLNVDQLRDLLTSEETIPEEKPVHEVVSVPEEKVVPPSRPEIPVLEAPPAVAPPPVEKKEVPLWQQFRQETTGQQPAPQRTRNKPVPPKQEQPIPKKTDPHKVPLWMQFRTPPESNPSDKQLDSVERMVLGEAGTRQRDLFIRNLFSGDVTEYENVIRRLEHTASWSEASKVLADEVFRKYRVNIYSDPAVAFTNAVEARFRRNG